jgi:valyl-tRNA synthetase
MKPLAEQAIKVVEEGKVKFYPERWKKVYLNWMYNIQDWCISRQIWWGHRLPVWYCKDCLENETTESQAGVVVTKQKPQKCPSCGSNELLQDDDVLDTWFSSWLWPFATFYWPNSRPNTADKKELDYFYPTSTLVTASEILFFWVARMIMAGLEFKKEIPFRDVIIHGTVRDNRGIKMSKSLGNIIDPLEIIDKFGTDSLRFSLMLNASGGADLYISDDTFLVGRNFANKIWNATRFILLKMAGKSITIENLDLGKYDEIDAWLLNELNTAITGVTSSLDNYRINDATKIAYEFFWHVFCDWYIEMVKDDFTKERAKISVYVLLSAMKLLHPVMPYISEEIFQLLKKNLFINAEESIVISKWPETIEVEGEAKSVKTITAIAGTIKEIRNIKIDLGLGQKKVGLTVRADKDSQQYWQKHETWIKRLSLLESIDFRDKLKRVVFKNELWELDLGVEDLDIKNFLVSLDKKINNLQNVHAKVSGRLNNENFLKNASGEVVEAERNKFAEVTGQLKRLEELKNAFK